MKKTGVVLSTLILLVVLLSQCSHANYLDKFGKESTTGSSRSHYTGANCMSCHNASGNEASTADKWWNVAGSAFDSDGTTPATSGIIELWSEPDRSGTLYYTLEIDVLGNFYSSKIIDYNSKCYPAVVRSNGDYQSMTSPFHGGGCNSCHGITTDPIEMP